MRSLSTRSKSLPSKIRGGTTSGKKIEDEQEALLTIKRPTSIAQVKSDDRVRKLEICARQIREFQHQTTWEKECDRKEKPKFHHFMFTYDEMVPEPHIVYARTDTKEKMVGSSSSYVRKALIQRLLAPI